MLTHFQEKLHYFIINYINHNQRSPSFREMTLALQISPKSKSLITRSLRALEKEGKLILRKQGRHVHIALSNKELVLLGRISAGQPIEAIPQPELLDINAIFAGKNQFALQVKGDSMIEEGIFDHDFIICRQTDLAKEGDIVVALIDQHHTTLKRISYKVKGLITLIPANSSLKPRAYLPEKIQIQGVYVGLIRVNR